MVSLYVIILKAWTVNFILILCGLALYSTES
jgi:hypothetical protein